jgi:hypothetical protein
MSASALDHVPHAAWLWRTSAGRSIRLAGVVAILGTSVVLALLDAAGYLRGVSYGLTVFLFTIVGPQAIVNIDFLDQSGALDEMRMSGNSGPPLLRALLVGLVLPILTVAMIFPLEGVAAATITDRQLVIPAILLGATTCLSVAAYLTPLSVRRSAVQIAFVLAMIAGAVTGIASASLDQFEAYRTITSGGVWPVVLAAESVVAIALLPFLARAVSRSSRGQAARAGGRWLPWLLPTARFPLLSRTLLHSVKGASLTLAVALAAMVAVMAIDPNGGPLGMLIVSAVIFLPIAGAISTVVHEGRQDVESNRFQFLRAMPQSPGRLAVLSVVGWTFPFALAAAIAVIAVRLMFGEWPSVNLKSWQLGPAAVALLLATLPAAAAAEIWLSRSTTHFIGIASGLLIVSQAYAPGRSIPPLVVSAAATAWIPWATAIAVFRQPERPRFGWGLVLAAVGAASAVVLYDFFAWPLDKFRPNPGALGIGLALMAPLLGAWAQVAASTVLILAISVALIVARGYPLGEGIAAVLLVPICLWAGRYVEGRWQGDGPTQVRVSFAYVVIAALIFLPLFHPRAGFIDLVRLTTQVYLAIAVLLVVAVVVSELLRSPIEQRRARRRPAGVAS